MVIRLDAVRRHLRHLPHGRDWLWPSVLAALVAVVVSAGAAAAIETDTVSSFWQGLWWSVSLITTVGFIGSPPRSAAGAVLSVVLMVAGFLLLAMVSASLAALFVREEDAPREAAEQAADTHLLTALGAVDQRLARLEAVLAERSAATDERGTTRPAVPADEPVLG